ncbi:MAG: LysM peptidoglycan-binding domain-containing protein, partial [Syntrophales bacterium LBB04]|nr:LysM peptidoglycan-binding domain-containing protein [Syntrophales bacterium LBB04]
MMKRRIYPWMGLIVLILFFSSSGETLAQEVYKVKQGDNIALIAKKHSVSMEALKTANKLGNNKLKINQVLTIPKQAQQKIAKANKSPAPKLDSYRVK